MFQLKYQEKVQSGSTRNKSKSNTTEDVTDVIPDTTGGDRVEEDATEKDTHSESDSVSKENNDREGDYQKREEFQIEEDEFDLVREYNSQEEISDSSNSDEEMFGLEEQDAGDYSIGNTGKFFSHNC